MEHSTHMGDKPKVVKIVGCALEIIRDRGDVGLSMRQVAARAGMSLSNLQHYFKNKDELLKAMVDYYFGLCERTMKERMEATAHLSRQEQVRDLILFGLEYGGELTEICRIFREFWAIATRNAAVNSHLEAYYSVYARLLGEGLEGTGVGPETARKTVGLLLPYFEGYSITSRALPISRDEIAEMLTMLTFSILERDGASGPET